MTVAARETLEDCRGALAELVDGIQGRDWRRKWILAVVLLRSVGHVLDNVDGKRSSNYRMAIDSWWSKLKDSRPLPIIFWQLIDQERNSILKAYQTTAEHEVAVQLIGIEIRINSAIYEPRTNSTQPTVHHYTFNSGPYKNRDQREVLAEAIVWWEQQLDAIDRMAELP
mgnify:CR=1 FL=1